MHLPRRQVGFPARRRLLPSAVIGLRPRDDEPFRGGKPAPRAQSPWVPPAETRAFRRLALEPSDPESSVYRRDSADLHSIALAIQPRLVHRPADPAWVVARLADPARPVARRARQQRGARAAGGVVGRKPIRATLLLGEREGDRAAAPTSPGVGRRAWDLRQRQAVDQRHPERARGGAGLGRQGLDLLEREEVELLNAEAALKAAQPVQAVLTRRLPEDDLAAAPPTVETTQSPDAAAPRASSANACSAHGPTEPQVENGHEKQVHRRRGDEAAEDHDGHRVLDLLAG